MPENKRDHYGSTLYGSGSTQAPARIIEITGDLREQARLHAADKATPFTVDPANRSSMTWHPITANLLNAYEESESYYG